MIKVLKGMLAISAIFLTLSCAAVEYSTLRVILSTLSPPFFTEEDHLVLPVAFTGIQNASWNYLFQP